jgi:hypothetical protein
MEGLGCISSGIPLEQVTAAWCLSSESCIILTLLSILISFKVPLIKLRISIYTDYKINKQNYKMVTKQFIKSKMLLLRVLIINYNVMECDVMQFGTLKSEPAAFSEA